MTKNITNNITAKGLDIAIITGQNNDDFVSLTDIARYQNPEAPGEVVKNWMRKGDTVDFLGLWEQLHNPNFKQVAFDLFKTGYRKNAFVLSPQKWIRETNAIGMTSASGRYGGGTLAHYDIAMEFTSWISPEFKLYVIQEFQRLKSNEAYQNSVEWNVRRELAKTNYIIHTDAVKNHLIPPELTKEDRNNVYASEGDLLNKALFGEIHSNWKRKNPKLKGNQRDNASIEQNIVMSGLENMNALLIEQGYSQSDRLDILRSRAITSLNAIISLASTNKVKGISDSQGDL
jgi:hypothetical protein